MLEYRKIKIEDKSKFDEILKEKKLLACEMNFSNFYIWKDVFKIECAVTENIIYVRGTLYDGTDFNYMPIAKPGYMDLGLETLLEEQGKSLFIKCGNDMILEEVSPEMLTKFQITEDVDISDYVYNSIDLITLKGKKYNKKRNHLNKFNSLYKYEFSPMEVNDIEECLELNKHWIASKEEQTADMQKEYNAVLNSLQNFELLDLKGGVIRIDGKIRAFTAGEIVHEDMGVVHFEKCDISYNGIYPAINQLFAEFAFSDVKYINRQDDMGLPGLRKSKKSYYPAIMVKKYTLEVI